MCLCVTEGTQMGAEQVCGCVTERTQMGAELVYGCVSVCDRGNTEGC